MEINWTSIIGVMVTIFVFISGVSYGALLLLIDNKLSKMEKSIGAHIDQRFAQKESIEYRLKPIEEDVKEIKDTLKKK